MHPALPISDAGKRRNCIPPKYLQGSFRDRGLQTARPQSPEARVLSASGSEPGPSHPYVLRRNPSSRREPPGTLTGKA